MKSFNQRLHMILSLIVFVACETDPTKLCLQKDQTDICPSGYQKITTTAADLFNLITNPATSIYTDTALGAIDITKLKKVNEIVGKGTSLTATCEISDDAEHTGLSLTGIDLAVTGDTFVLKFASLTLNDGGSIKTSSAITVVNLKCTTIKSAATAVIYAKETGSIFTLEGNDVITKIEQAGDGNKGVKLTDSADNVDVTSTVSTNVISTITKKETFTLSGDLSKLEATVSIELKNGNAAGVFVTLKEESNFAKNTKLTIYVNTVFCEDSSLSDIAKEVITRDTKNQVDVNGARLTVPAASSYCLPKDNENKAKCIKGTELLWNAKELKNAKNGTSPFDLHLLGYDKNDILALTFADIKDKQINFIGDGSVQKISFNFGSNLENRAKFVGFINISVKAIVSTNVQPSLKFDKLYLKTSEISASTSSKTLKANGAIKINSKDLTSDAASFIQFKAEKPDQSLAIEDPGSITFAGDGKSVTIDGHKIEAAKIPESFAIQFSPKAPKAEFKIFGEPTSLINFSINLLADTKFTATYSGDWSNTKIIVSGEQGSEFTNKVSKDEGSKSPQIEPKGDVIVPSGNSPNPTDKGGLSGGAIAGIVIACVVVVAAIIVAVVIVIKKKAKVGN